jgi:hypothetical protein
MSSTTAQHQVGETRYPSKSRKRKAHCPDGLDRDLVAVELRRISWRTARAALEFLAEQNPPVGLAAWCSRVAFMYRRKLSRRKNHRPAEIHSQSPNARRARGGAPSILLHATEVIE